MYHLRQKFTVLKTKTGSIVFKPRAVSTATGRASYVIWCEGISNFNIEEIEHLQYSSGKFKFILGCKAAWNTREATQEEVDKAFEHSKKYVLDFFELHKNKKSFALTERFQLEKMFIQDVLGGIGDLDFYKYIGII